MKISNLFLVWQNILPSVRTGLSSGLGFDEE
jgi:hypothetical protein